MKNRQWAQGDYLILYALRIMGVATATQIGRFVGRSEKMVRNRNIYLREIEGWTKMLKIQDETDDFRQRGQRGHYLTRAGWTKAYSLGIVPDLHYAEDKKPKFAEHDIARNDVLLTYLPLVARQEVRPGVSVPIVEGMEKYLVYQDPRDGSRNVRPDMFFLFQDGEDVFPFFLELEKSEHTKFDELQAKVEHYERFWESGMFEKKYGYPNFRVAVIMPTLRRTMEVVSRIPDMRVNPMRVFVAEKSSPLSFHTPSGNFNFRGEQV